MKKKNYLSFNSEEEKHQNQRFFSSLMKICTLGLSRGVDVCVDVIDAFTHLFDFPISSNEFVFFRTLTTLNCGSKHRIPQLNKFGGGQVTNILFRAFFDNFIFLKNFGLSCSPNALCCPCYFDSFLGFHLKNNLQRPHSQSNFRGKKKTDFPQKWLIYSTCFHLVTCRVLFFCSPLRKSP